MPAQKLPRGETCYVISAVPKELLANDGYSHPVGYTVVGRSFRSSFPSFLACCLSTSQRRVFLSGVYARAELLTTEAHRTSFAWLQAPPMLFVLAK